MNEWTEQYVYNRGIAKVDDVMHNTLGCKLESILEEGAEIMVKGIKSCW